MTSSLSFSLPGPCLLVAEIGSNHQGSVDMAHRCVDEAARAGADMVKFQKRNLHHLFTPNGLNRPYPGRNSFGRTYGEHRQRLELPLEALAELKAHAETLGLTFFASMWDEHSLEDMLSLGVHLLKLPSADITNLRLIRRCALTRLPLILSTGMSTLAEIDAAVAEVVRIHDQVMLLHCNSSYPCVAEEIGLPVMNRLAARYGLPVGYSGHECGLGPSVAAAALGARLIERHFTLDKSLAGSDHACSLTPREFGDLSHMVREVEAAMRVREKRVFPGEQEAAVKLRKIVVSTAALPAGHILTGEDVILRCAEKLPGGTGLTHPDQVLGHRLRHAVAEGQPLVMANIVPDPAADVTTKEAL